MRPRIALRQIWKRFNQTPLLLNDVTCLKMVFDLTAELVSTTLFAYQLMERVKNRSAIVIFLSATGSDNLKRLKDQVCLFAKIAVSWSAINQQMHGRRGSQATTMITIRIITPVVTKTIIFVFFHHICLRILFVPMRKSREWEPRLLVLSETYWALSPRSTSDLAVFSSWCLVASSSWRWNCQSIFTQTRPLQSKPRWSPKGGRNIRQRCTPAINQSPEL